MVKILKFSGCTLVLFYEFFLRKYQYSKKDHISKCVHTGDVYVLYISAIR